MLKHYFEMAGLGLVEEHLQIDWPADFLNLKLFALKPLGRH